MPTAELPALLSKALKKVSSLESKIKNVEKENSKLSKSTFIFYRYQVEKIGRSNKRAHW